MKSFIYFLSFIWSLSSVLAQTPTDGGYRYTDVVRFLTKEYNYKDSVEAKGGYQAYQKAEKYYFAGIYKGKKRKVTNPLFSNPNEIALAYLAYQPSAVNQPKEEVLIEVDGEKLWIPLSPRIEKDFLEEVKIGQKVEVFCVYLCEHTNSHKFYSTFLMTAYY